MKRSAAEIKDFIEGLEIPRPRSTRAGAVAPTIEFTSDQEVVAVGPQLAEFSDSVSADLRPMISNTMLLAQLAADKATAQSDDVLDWHEKYRDVLSKVGWQVHDAQDQLRVIKDKNLRVHKAIIPVLTALLGNTAAAASMIVTVLKGLEEMDQDSPWITLFERQSQHAKGAKFQLSYVDADPNGEPSIKLLSCAIKAEKTITQVLFFKFSSQRAEMHDRSTQLSTNRDVLAAGKDAISAKVGSFINDFVKGIEI
jgi:hypothetical protein